MYSIWNKINKNKIENLSKKLVAYNKKFSINAIEKNHYNHIRDIFLTIISTEILGKSVSILDYGSNILTISNLKNKLNCNKIKFSIYDPYYTKNIYKFSHINYIKFRITNNFNKIKKEKYDVINFGSSMQYESNIFNKIDSLNIKKSKYITISNTPLSMSKSYVSYQKKKQNLLQKIYSFNEIVSFFKKNKFKLIFKSRNENKYISCKTEKYKTYSLNLIFKNEK